MDTDCSLFVSIYSSIPLSGKALAAKNPTEIFDGSDEIIRSHFCARLRAEGEKVRAKLLMVVGLLLILGGGAAAWWFLFGPGAEDDAAQRSVRIKEVITVTRLNERTEEFVAAFGQGTKQGLSHSGIPDSAATALNKLAGDLFNADVITRRITGQLEQQYNRKRIKAVIDFYKSDAGVHIASLSNKNLSQEAALQLLLSASSDRPSEERMRLYKSIGNAVKVSKVMEMMDIMANGMAKGFGADLGVGLPSGARSEMAAQMEKIMPLIMHATYSQASDAELAAYLKFLESEAGRWFYDAITQAFMDEMKVASEKFGAGLRRVVAEAAKNQKVATVQLAEDSSPVADAPAPALVQATISQPEKSTPRRGSLSGKDARECLNRPTDREIMVCAERYR